MSQYVPQPKTSKRPHLAMCTLVQVSMMTELLVLGGPVRVWWSLGLAQLVPELHQGLCLCQQEVLCSFFCF